MTFLSKIFIINKFVLVWIDFGRSYRFSTGAGLGVDIFDWNRTRSRSDFHSQCFLDINVFLHFMQFVT